MIPNYRHLALAAGLLFFCVGCAGRNFPLLGPIAPTAAPIPPSTLAAWKTVLQAYRAGPGSFMPFGPEAGPRYSHDPVYLWDAGGPDERPAPAGWLAQLVADSVIDGVCGYYNAIACWSDVRAVYVSFAEPKLHHGDSLEVEMELMSQTRSLCGTAEWEMHQEFWQTMAMLVEGDSGLRVARDTVTSIGDEATCIVTRAKGPGSVDTLRAAIRDSALDAAMAEIATAELLDAPARRTPVYLSPFRGLGAADTAGRHDRAWLDAVVQRYHLTGICAGYGSADCPHHGDALYLALTLPHVLPNGLVRLESYRMSVTGHNWGAATTPLFLSRSGRRWTVFCRDVTIFDDGTIGPQK